MSRGVRSYGGALEVVLFARNTKEQYKKQGKNQRKFKKKHCLGSFFELLPVEQYSESLNRA
jgi:hypothetical protein